MAEDISSNPSTEINKKNREYTDYAAEALSRFLILNRWARWVWAIIALPLGLFVSYVAIKYCWFVAIPNIYDWAFSNPVQIWKAGLGAFAIIYPAMGGVMGPIFAFLPLMTAITAFNQANSSLGEERIIKEKKKVFIVHGHDEGAKLATARFLQTIELTPIILHEQVNMGKTIIEKFEKNSTEVGYAIILMTPDDIGRSREETSEQFRARQNVVLELGYFIGTLGRNRVAVLVKDSVDIPSDYMGVVYIPMDENGGWMLKVAKEIKSAGLKLNTKSLMAINS